MYSVSIRNIEKVRGAEDQAADVRSCDRPRAQDAEAHERLGVALLPPTNAPSNARAATPTPTVRADVHPRPGLRDRVDERREPAVTSIAPGTSKVRTLASRLSFSSRGASTNASAPTGTLTKKIHDQLSASVSTPPSSTPAAAPKPPTAPQTPSAMLRSRPSVNVVERIESAAGEMMAAPRPCTARARDQRRLAPREPRDERGDREHDQAREEKAPPPEQVGGAAAEEQEPAEDERVGADHPLEVLLGEPEIDLDGGQRDVHDRDIQDDHELDRAQERQASHLRRSVVTISVTILSLA